MKITIIVLAILLMGAATAIMSPAQQLNGQIAFSSDRNGDREIYVMNPDGTNQVRLTNNVVFDDFPDWSPDGQKIVFLSRRTDGIWAVFIMNKDGTGRTEVTQVNVPNLN